MSTDAAWEEWGRRDPYFGVITNKKFRRSELTAESKAEFFESGRVHVEYVMQMIRQHIHASFAPGRVLDFGCGVGRLVVPFAKIATMVEGLDVSTSMLEEARRNCDELGVTNVQFIESDDELSKVSSTFDLIHAYIVFQHIPVGRGRLIFQQLLAHLAPGGIGAFHFTYAKARYAENYGIAPSPEGSAPSEPAITPAPEGADPDMQMNSYQMNEVLFVLQSIGVHRFHAEFTDHGGELGTFLFFQRS